MSSDMNGDPRSRDRGREEPIDSRRYLEALRRNRRLMVAIVVVITGAVLALSLLLPKQYQATASLVIDPSASAFGSEDADSTQRQLATMQALVSTSDVLAQAARAVPGETRTSLRDAVSVTLNEDANIIDITATYRTPEGAAALAAALARAFIRRQTDIERSRFERAETMLGEQIAQLRADPAAVANSAEQIQALEQRQAELSVAAASAGSDIQLTQQPDPPTSPSSPKPVRNALLAFFAAIFIAVLAALGRDQLTPRVANERELGHLLRLPILSGIPYRRRRTRARDARAEYETYQTLSAAVRLALPPDGGHVILVTSAVHGEGKTTVAQRLARLLAQAGHDTLLVSGDLRWPKLDEECRVVGKSGVRDLLAEMDGSSGMLRSALKHMIVPLEQESARASLDILPAGRHDGDVSGLLTMSALQPLFTSLRRLPYNYVIVDAPPILGVADTRIIAHFCDDLLVVSRMDRLTMTNVVDLREALDRTDINTIGLVVLGARISDSPYYWAESPRAPSRA
jgi:Mrp family chromosome partitioning ATPase